jgi:4-amino-4-deoxy-L-arabinose transferase-like glycosyltransferase
VGPRVERTVLAVVLILFAALGAIYSIVVPPFEASDELWHYPMVKYIADHWALPVQDPANVGPWRQEGSQPPLYYALAAAAISWIDTSDVDAVRYLNPHVDNGVATPDGNINLVVHQPARDSFPWRGTALAVHLIRFLSVSMGTAAVYLTYLIVREILPDEPALALGAAAVHAFTPMFVFIAGAVNNDNLVVPLSSLALLMLLRLVRRRTLAGVVSDVGDASTPDGRGCSWPESYHPTFASVPVGRYLLLGIVLGLAVLTKTSSLALTVLTALVVGVRAVRRRSWAEFFVGGLATLLPLLAIAGWWFLRNLRLYGDLTGFNAFFEILGTRDVPADLAQLWRERFSFLAGYWGNFGGLNVPMPAWVYSTLNALTVVAALGLVILLLRQIFRAQKHLVICHLSFVISLLWALGVLGPWLWWARVTWSSQGRLVFPAISVWSLLLALGLAGWLGQRWGRWAVAAFALFLLGLAAAVPFAWIAPAYALPEPLTDAQVAAIPHRVAADFGTTDSGSVMRLLGYGLGAEAVEPGGQMGVTLYWEALAPADRDHTVFVHLLGEGELLVAQRDTFPGLGRLSTTWLEPGFRWADRTVLQVPGTAYAPDVAQIEVGLYDAGSGLRLPAVGLDGELLGDNLRFGRVQVRARPGDYPNPISVNFGDRMEMVGYDLDRRVVHAGETATLTLHWRGLRPMDVNYTVSAQLVDVGQRKAAQHDGWPLDGAAPTAAWEPGRALADPYALAVYPDALPGVYDVRVAVYVLEDGEIVHLPVISEGGQMLFDYVVLTQVRVVP